MTRGSYIIQEGADGAAPVSPAPKRPDTSFRSCVLTLGLFAIFCFIIILALALSGSGSGSGTNEEESATTETILGKHAKYNEEVIPFEDTTTTTTTTTTRRTTTKQYPIKEVTIKKITTTELSTESTKQTTHRTTPVTKLETEIEKVEPPTTSIPAITSTDGRIIDTFVHDISSTPKHISTSVNDRTERIRERIVLDPDITSSTSQTEPVSPVEHINHSSITFLETTPSSTEPIRKRFENESTTADTTMDESHFEPVTKLIESSSERTSTIGSTPIQHTSSDTSLEFESNVRTSSSYSSSTPLTVLASHMPTISTEESETDVRSSASDTSTAETETISSLTETKSGKMIHSEWSSTSCIDTPVCNTTSCKNLASRMLSLMKHNVSPCENFYEFACGGLQGTATLLSDNPQEEVWNRITGELNKINESSPRAYREFAAFHSSCLLYDSALKLEDRKQRIKALINNVGNINNISSPIEDITHLSGLIVAMIKYNRSQLFDVLLDVDQKDVSKLSLTLVPPGFGFSFRPDEEAHSKCFPKWDKETHTNIDLNERYSEYQSCKADHTEYLRKIEAVFDDLNLSEIDLFKKNAENIQTTIEVLLNTIDENLADRRRIQLQKNYTEYTAQGLQGKYSLIDWNYLVSELLKDPAKTDTKVQVYFEKFFDILFDKLKDEDVESLYVSLLAMFAHDMYEDFIKPNPCDRQKYCLSVATSLMSDVASGLYLRSFSEDEINTITNQVQSIFNSLIATFHNAFNETLWLTETSYSALTEKLGKINIVLDGGKDIFLNDGFLEFKFKEVEMSNDYFSNSLNLLQYHRKQMYSKFSADPRQPEQLWSVFLHPYSTEAVVLHKLNTVAIPIGLMTTTLASAEYPSYIRWSKIGTVIAQAIAHHFDPTGLSDTLESESIEAADTYDRIINCFKFQYLPKQSLKLDNTTHVQFQLNFNLPMDDIISDSSALNLAYETYRNLEINGDEPLPWLGMSWEKLYFLSHAQMLCSKKTILDYSTSIFEDKHLPTFLRVNKMMMNSVEFATVFGCHSKSKMNNPNKCEPFPFLKNTQHSNEEINMAISK